MALAYGEPSVDMDMGAYARLATAVVVRAIRDVHGVGGVSAMQQSYFKKTARAFLSDPSHGSLHLWCAWLKMDPIKMQEASVSILNGKPGDTDYFPRQGQGSVKE
tara:strand:+ start:11783 stop:12097 length:315 start_codon:yes stop_codon:yes gene_type:complete